MLRGSLLNDTERGNSMGGVYADHRIDNMIMANGTTRCWDRRGIYDVPTVPEAVRPPMACRLWQVETSETSFSHRTRVNTIDEMVKKILNTKEKS